MGKISEFLKDIKSDKFLTVAVIILIISGMTLSWSIYELSDSEEMKDFPRSPPNPDDNGYSNTDKNIYHLREPVTIKFVINYSEYALPEVPTIDIYSYNKEDGIFSISVRDIENTKQIDSGTLYLLQWNQKNNNGDYVQPGKYRLNAHPPWGNNFTILPFTPQSTAIGSSIVVGITLIGIAVYRRRE